MENSKNIQENDNLIQMEEKVKTILNEILGIKPDTIFRLLGGMSNYTYVISSGNEKYTVRIPGEYAEEFVSRDVEKDGIEIFENLDITNKTIYFNNKTGVKISKYIPGISLNEINERYYDKVCNLLKIIHTAQINYSIDYDPFTRLNSYEKSLGDYEFPVDYLKVRNSFLTYKDYLEKIEKVFCHNDSQPSNFIINEEKDLSIVDFEFIGNNDYIYDIACYGNMDFKDAIELLKVYENGNVSNDKWKRLYLWRCYQALQWFNVAMFKELHGLSISLKIDFKNVALFYLNIAIECLNKASSF